MARRAGGGIILCECCQFDFFAKYGKLGEGFIEAHHKMFLSTGSRRTKPEDFAMVCSNCHRMLHTKKEDGVYHTVGSLQELVAKEKVGGRNK